MSGLALPEIMPRSIVVVDSVKYQLMAADAHDVELLQSTDAMVIPFTGSIKHIADQVEPVRQLLKESDQFAPGVVLIKDPFAKAGYVPAVSSADALSALASTKYHLLANTVRLLGAREFSFEDVRAEHDATEVAAEVSVKAPAKAVDVQVSQTTSITNRLRAKLEGKMLFEGGEPDSKAALEHLRLHQLDGDQQMRTLVEMRTGQNLITQYRLTFNCTRESVLNVKAAASVAKVVGVEANFQMNSTSLSEIEIETTILF